MKKSTLALLVAGAAGNMASAQNSVTVYGSLDGGLRNLTNVDAAGNGRLSMNSNGTYKSSRLGFDGKEDLGGGMDAHFNLESRFKVGSGEQVGVLFNAASYVGVGGAWGSVDVGKQFTLPFKTIVAYDPFSLKYTGIVSAISATLGVTDNNALQYTGTFGPVVTRLTYGLGEQAGSSSNGAMQGAAMSYRQGMLNYGGGYTQKKSIIGLDTKHYTAGGGYTFGKMRVSGGYANQRDQVLGKSDTVTKYSWAGLQYNLTAPLQLIGAYYRTDKEQALAPANGLKETYILSATYALSKRTNLYAEVDRNKYSGNFVLLTQTGQTGVSAGINTLF
jgi:predicted porin